jgi:hypothetical protein
MTTYKITLTDLTDLVFDVYVEAVSADRACEAVASKGLFIVAVES